MRVWQSKHLKASEINMGNNQSVLSELYVYECRGNQPPQTEPRFEGYLGLWPEPPFYYLFADRQVLSQVNDWVLEQPGWSVRDQYLLDYDQWQQGGMESCEIGSFRILKHGSLDISPDLGRTIWLQPGLVFGSGLHPTTQACLLAIDRYQHQLRGAKVIDLGTGSGVLALACARLGAAGVLAVDCNPMAVRETTINIGLNRLGHRIQPVRAMGLGAFRTSLDWLIMNLEFPVLLQLLTEESWRGYPNVLLSGFMPAMWAELQRFVPPRYALNCRIDRHGWCAVLLQSPASGACEKPGIVSG